jgi:hypothetical protein
MSQTHGVSRGNITIKTKNGTNYHITQTKLRQVKGLVSEHDVRKQSC